MTDMRDPLLWGRGLGDLLGTQELLVSKRPSIHKDTLRGQPISGAEGTIGAAWLAARPKAHSRHTAGLPANPRDPSSPVLGPLSQLVSRKSSV